MAVRHLTHNDGTVGWCGETDVPIEHSLRSRIVAPDTWCPACQAVALRLYKVVLSEPMTPVTRNEGCSGSGVAGPIALAPSELTAREWDDLNGSTIESYWRERPRRLPRAV